MRWKLERHLCMVLLITMIGLSFVFFTPENVHANEHETNELEPLISVFQDREGIYPGGFGGELYVGYDPEFGDLQTGIQFNLNALRGKGNIKSAALRIRLTGLDDEMHQLSLNLHGSIEDFQPQSMPRQQSWKPIVSGLTDIQEYTPGDSYEINGRSLANYIHEQVNTNSNPEGNIILILNAARPTGEDLSQVLFDAAAIELTVVTGKNSAPVIVHQSNAVYTVKRGGATSSININRIEDDGPTLASATVSFNRDYIRGEDVLEFNSSIGGITSSFDPVSGKLMLESKGATATVEQWKSALQRVVYRNISETPTSRMFMLNYSVSDGELTSSGYGSFIRVVNDPPVIRTSSGTASYTTDQPSIAVDEGLTLTDHDSRTAAFATVSITRGYQQG